MSSEKELRDDVWPKIKFVTNRSACGSTVHAIPNIAESDFRLLKFFWIICFLGSTGFCGYMISRTISDYLEYEVVTEIRTIGQSQAPFPTVIICNKNFVVNQKSADYVDQKLKDTSIQELTDNLIEYYDPLRYYFTSSLNIPEMSDAERQSYGLQMNEMIIRCSFNNVPCNMSYWTPRYDSYFANCFMFNSLQNSTLYSTIAGKFNALSVALYLPSYDNYYTFSRDLGVHVFINDISIKKTSVHEGYEASVNTETNIGLDRLYTNMLPPPYFDCMEKENIASYGSIFTDLFTKNGLTYRQKDCFDLCYQRKLVDLCGCYDTSIPLLTYNMTPCQLSVDKFFCNNQLFMNFSKIVNANCSAECPLECSSIKFSATIFSTKFPKNSYYYQLLAESDNLAGLFNLSSSHFRSAIMNNRWQDLPPIDVISSKLNNKTMILNVFYNALEYTQIDASPKTTAIDLLANVGGTLGLFIGASFLSFIELVDWAIQVGIIVAFKYLIK